MRRRAASAVTWLWMLAFASACGGAVASGPQSTDTSLAAIDPESRALAPDLAARVDRAHADAAAAAAESDEAQGDHEERARLWQIALVSEVQRIRLAREREAIQREVETIETRRAADEQKRAVIAREVQRERAAEVARAEAARVFAEAAEDESRRRGGDAARVAARRDTTQALLERAAAVIEATVALGAAESAVATARRAIDVARRRNDGSPAAVESGQRAWFLAQAALGDARQRHGVPTVEERASLLEALAHAGLAAETLEEGVVIWLPAPFAAGRKDVSKGEAAVLRALGGVLSAHPHGPVQLQARVAMAGQRVAATKLNGRVTAALQGVASARVLSSVLVVSADSVGTEVRVVLPAYGCSALPNENDACARGTSVVQAASP